MHWIEIGSYLMVGLTLIGISTVNLRSQTND